MTPDGESVTEQQMDDQWTQLAKPCAECEMLRAELAEARKWLTSIHVNVPQAKIYTKQALHTSRAATNKETV